MRKSNSANTLLFGRWREPKRWSSSCCRRLVNYKKATVGAASLFHGIGEYTIHRRRIFEVITELLGYVRPKASVFGSIPVSGIL